MTERAVVMSIPDKNNPEAEVATWTGLLPGDNGKAIQMPLSSDRTIQFTGTFGVGGSIQLEGSLDNANYEILTDPQGNNIVKTGSALEAVTELTAYVRPRVTAGDGTTSLTASLLIKR